MSHTTTQIIGRHSYCSGDVIEVTPMVGEPYRYCEDCGAADVPASEIRSIYEEEASEVEQQISLSDIAMLRAAAMIAEARKEAVISITPGSSTRPMSVHVDSEFLPQIAQLLNLEMEVQDLPADQCGKTDFRWDAAVYWSGVRFYSLYGPGSAHLIGREPALASN